MDADGGAESNDGLRVAEMGSALLFRRWRDFGGCPRARNHPTVMVLLGHCVIFEVLYSVIG